MTKLYAITSFFSMYKQSCFEKLREKNRAAMHESLCSDIDERIRRAQDIDDALRAEKSHAIERSIEGIRMLLCDPSGDIFSMFASPTCDTESVIPILDALLIVFSPDDDGRTNVNLECVRNERWPEFLGWVISTRSNPAVMRALYVVKFLVCVWFDAGNSFLFDLVVPHLSSDNVDVKIAAMNVIEIIFKKSEQHQQIIVSDANILETFLKNVEYGPDLVTKEAMLVLRLVFFCCNEHPEILEFLSPEYCTRLITATFHHMDRLRTTSKNAMKLLRTMCLTERVFFLAVDCGLINCLLRFMVVCGNTKRCGIIRALYELVYTIVMETKESRITVKITNDSRFFSSIRRFLKAVLEYDEMEPAQALLNVIGEILEENTRELYEEGIFDTCLEFVGSIPFALETYVLSMLMFVMEKAGPEIRLRMATPKLIENICKIVEADDIQIAVEAANCLAGMLELHPVEIYEKIVRSDLDGAITVMEQGSEEGEIAGRRLREALEEAEKNVEWGK